MAKTVKITGTFEVVNAANTVEAKKVIRDEKSVEEATQHFPHKIAANQADVQIGFGGVAQAKRVYVRVNQEVTLKINQSTDTGFPFGPGDGYFSSYSGITGIWITTGPNETELEAIITGD
jgi:hypothetical protein